MKKRIIGLLVVLAVTVFSLPGCVRADEFARHKAEAKAELEAYALGLGEANYTAENWAAIQDIVEEGKTAIDAAKDKADVDAAVTAAKEAMNAVELAQYKANAKAALEAYAESLEEDDYLPWDWTAIQELVAYGKAEIDAAKDKGRVDAVRQVMERDIDSMPKNFWKGKVVVTIVFPAEVVQGDTFEITVTTTNITDEDFEYYSSSTEKNLGVYVSRIKSQSTAYKFFPFTESTHDFVLTTIPAGESIEHLWEFETKHDRTLPTWGDYAPKGVYDIYLSNGEIYRNAITIV